MAVNFQQAPVFQAFTAQMKELKQNSQTFQHRATEKAFSIPEQDNPLVDASLNHTSALGALQNQIDSLNSVVTEMAGQVGTNFNTKA